jgi:hypothetical protein
VKTQSFRSAREGGKLVTCRIQALPEHGLASDGVGPLSA